MFGAFKNWVCDQILGLKFSYETRTEFQISKNLAHFLQNSFETGGAELTMVNHHYKDMHKIDSRSLLTLSTFSVEKRENTLNM